MRTLIVAVTCLAIGAGLNAPGTGANSTAETTINPFQAGDMGAELEAIREDLQPHFDKVSLEGLHDLMVATEWQNRDLTEKNARLLKSNNEQGWELLEIRNKLRKCEKR